MGCRLVFVSAERDVPVACQDINRLLRLQRRRGGGADGPILGAWIETTGVLATAPAALRVPVSESERVRLSLRESMGVAGKWVLATFDATPSTDFFSIAPLQVLEALLEWTGRCSSGRFAPVFATSLLPAVVEANIAGLRTVHPRRFAAPLLLDPATGVLQQGDRF